MYPGTYAQQHPDRIAVLVAGTDDVLTYGELERRSAKLANAFRDLGLNRGDGVALLSTNNSKVFEVYWACLRSGLYLTPVNTHLSAAEITYIVDDCDAKVLVASDDLIGVAAQAAADCAKLTHRVVVGSATIGFVGYEELVEHADARPPKVQPRGADMLYSSGTTGRPKGVKPALPERQVGDPGDPYVAVFGGTYGMSESTVYFSPAPLYHAAPLRFGMVVHSLGGTVITTGKFDAEESLRIIDTHQVTHSQWVPTHFVRLLRLPESVRAAHSVRTITHAIHAAAPCPAEVKQAMIDWWGPVLYEYYASTEANGVTMVGPQEWLARPGTVGQAKLGTIHVCADDGTELPAGQAGVVFFERDAMPFRYHKDPVKTRDAQHRDHETWSTCGDIGFVDDAGYLFLRDRKAFTIISGGVNIYPQEIEDCLVLHPEVDDVAVIGVPDAEFGERVVAVVKRSDDNRSNTAIAADLQAFVRDRLAGYKVPREFHFVSDLPRTPTGKLVKGPLRARFLNAQ